MRQGQWKIVSSWPSRSWELYDLAVDQGETKDLAAQYPQIVEDLSAQYRLWAEKNGVVDFAILEEVEPKSMQEFRRSKSQKPMY